MIEQFGDAVRVHIRVQPRASRTEVVGPFGDAVKIRVAAPPVDGAANDELVRCVSRLLRIAAGRVHVIGGAASRSKIIEIAGADAEDVRRALLG